MEEPKSLQIYQSPDLMFISHLSLKFIRE